MKIEYKINEKHDCIEKYVNGLKVLEMCNLKEFCNELNFRVEKNEN